MYLIFSREDYAFFFLRTRTTTTAATATTATTTTPKRYSLQTKHPSPNFHIRSISISHSFKKVMRG
jgi:hypothetical protein